MYFNEIRECVAREREAGNERVRGRVRGSVCEEEGVQEREREREKQETRE